MKLLLLLLLGVVPSVFTTLTRVQKLGEANNEFSIKMYNKLVETMKEDSDSGNKNLFYGPLSIYTAMAMVYLGANGDTKEQIEQVMRYENIDANFHESFQDLNSIIFAGNKNYTLKSANRLFADKTFDPKIKQSYKTDTSNFYGAGLETKDFANAAEAARVEINEWVEGQTEQKIEDLMPDGSIDSMTILVLVNAMYFKGDWKSPFKADYTKAGNFYTTESESVSMDFMKKTEKYPIHVNAEKKIKVLEMPYAGDEISMFVVLPDDRMGLEALEKTLTIDLLKTITDETQFQRYGDVEVSFPKFEVAQKFSLIDTMKDLGIKNLFTDSADLSGIADAKLFMSSLFHKAFVKVNEEGTEAAAATGGGISLTSIGEPPVEFKADHPFMYFIREKSSGAIIFMGRIQEEASVSATFQRQAADDDDDDDDDDDNTGKAGVMFASSLCIIMSLVIPTMF